GGCREGQGSRGFYHPGIGGAGAGDVALRRGGVPVGGEEGEGGAGVARIVLKRRRGRTGLVAILGGGGGEDGEARHEGADQIRGGGAVAPHGPLGRALQTQVAIRFSVGVMNWKQNALRRKSIESQKQGGMGGAGPSGAADDTTHYTRITEEASCQDEVSNLQDSCNRTPRKVTLLRRNNAGVEVKMGTFKSFTLASRAARDGDIIEMTGEVDQAWFSITKNPERTYLVCQSSLLCS
ncbi:hypothetical protein KFL_017540010, partial [Klebsormidium nitens]